MHAILLDNSTVINSLCKTYKVEKLYAFGSVLTKKFNKESDIDLLVEFKSMNLLEYADNYFDFKFKLQDTLKYPIDLLEEKAVKNPFFKKSMDENKELVYIDKNQKIISSKH
jgi:uncharacterized protein